jgi:hypothetical protein
MGGGGHGLPKVSPRLAMPDLSMPCRKATPKTVVSGMAHRLGGLRPSFTPLDSPGRTSVVGNLVEALHFKSSLEDRNRNSACC